MDDVIYRCKFGDLQSTGDLSVSSECIQMLLFSAVDKEKKRVDGRQRSTGEWVNGSAQFVLVATHDGVCT